MPQTPSTSSSESILAFDIALIFSQPPSGTFDRWKSFKFWLHSLCIKLYAKISSLSVFHILEGTTSNGSDTVSRWTTIYSVIRSGSRAWYMRHVNSLCPAPLGRAQRSKWTIWKMRFIYGQRIVIYLIIWDDKIHYCGWNLFCLIVFCLSSMHCSDDESHGGISELSTSAAARWESQGRSQSICEHITRSYVDDIQAHEHSSANCWPF